MEYAETPSARRDAAGGLMGRHRSPPPTDHPTWADSEVERLPQSARKPATEHAVDTLLRASGLATPSSADLSDLYRRLRHRVKHLVTCVLGGRTTPGDLVQDVCAEIVMSKGHFQHESEFGSWVNAVVRRHVYKWLRGQQRYHRFLRDLAERTAARGPPPPDESLEVMRTVRRTAEALNSLPGLQKECILLLAVEGVSGREAAERLRTTPAAVRTATSRARTRLREVLATTESAGTTACGIESSKHSAWKRPDRPVQKNA